MRRGFDQGEVRDFLRMVAAELARLQERERFLENELRAIQTRGMSAPGRLDEETVTTLLGEEAARVLSTARDASAQIRERAEESATRLVKDAAEDAARIRESAMLEAARIREDATSDAESEIEMAKQQGRDMVNEAREYREKVLSELTRRRDAARAQIEQLLHGRDRLINAFQRARTASDSVIEELTGAHDEPEFIVDLSPTTGPVPVVNPAHPSVKPRVRVFDREAEDPNTVEAARPAPIEQFARPGAITEVSTIEVSVEDRHIEVEEIESAVEETVEDHGHHHDDRHDDPRAVEETSIGDADAVTEPEALAGIELSTPAEDATGSANIAPADEGETTPSNVVSLFGRGRRGTVPTDVPSIEPEPAPDTLVDAVERAAGDHGSSTSDALNEIFSRLKSETTADVAARVNGAPRAGGAPSAGKTPRTDEAPRPDEPSRTEGRTKQVPSPVAPDPEIFARRDGALVGLVPNIARHLKRALADEQNEVLGHLRTKRSSLEIDAFLGAPEAHAQRFAGAIATETLAAAGSGAKDARGSVRRVAAEQLSIEMTTALRGSVVDDFRRDVSVALEESHGDRDVLADLLRDVYRAWKTEKMDATIESIARRAYGLGALLSLEPGVDVAWMVAPGGCCSDCEDNSLAGAQHRDEAFPTGHSHAPAHAGCHCLVWPVRK